jgi:hypothetical protein
MPMHPDAKKCKEAYDKAVRLLKQGRLAEEKTNLLLDKQQFVKARAENEKAKKFRKQAWFQAQKTVEFLGIIAVQPLCSIILTTAATCAMCSGELDEAERLVKIGWDRNPPDEQKARLYKVGLAIQWAREQATEATEEPKEERMDVQSGSLERRPHNDGTEAERCA